MKKHSFIYQNGLSIAFILLMTGSWIGQMYTGWLEHNDFLKDHKQPGQLLPEYMLSGHFIQATFENWESEFFQMTLFVVLTIFLRQKGSSESKDCDDETFDRSE